MATPILPRFESGRADGAVVAAYLAAALALLTLALVQLGTVLSKDFGTFVFSLGKAWVPNAQGIGPYSGKETLMLLGWLGSWAVLNFALRGKQLSVRTTFGAALGILALATLLMWPPAWHVFAP